MWHLRQIAPIVFGLPIVDGRVIIVLYLVVYLVASTFSSLWKGTTLLMSTLPRLCD